ncbi:MAG TPA: hypothetical protein VN285_03960 [Candidatus Deferrimicrobium sp.]|nr:hypothetical protein [Candidatus Deferrimicrobium sp.]
MKQLIFRASVCVWLTGSLGALSVAAAESDRGEKPSRPVIQKAIVNTFSGDERPDTGAVVIMPAPRKTLGSAAVSGSPGVIVNPANGGNTTYEYQHNGSIGRQIAHGAHGMPDTQLIHFVYMDMPGYAFVDRGYQYEVWDALNGAWGTGSDVTGSLYGGFVNIAVTAANQAIVTGHVRPTDPEPTRIFTYFDSGRGLSSFPEAQIAPDSVDFYCEGDSLTESGHIWPKLAYTETATDTVLHIIAERTDGPGLVSYFRGVLSWDSAHSDASVVWDYPQYCVDTVTDIAYDIVARDNKVAMIWFSNLPKPGDCDTCSSSGYWPYGQWDNDLYWQISTDAGLTWQPRVNVTKNQNGVEGYRPYTDASCLIDAGGNLHVVTVSQYWPADINLGGTVSLGVGRIFHYASNDVTDGVYNARTVHNFEWEQTHCDGGSWMLNAGKLAISECDGKLYTLFVQYNDHEAGIMDDCSSEDSPGYPNGAANGELYLTISDDGGITWDIARNLTNSRTPGCDSTGGPVGPCQSDSWPSMTRYGSNYAGIWPPEPSFTVVPAGSTDLGDYFLHIQYMNDHSAGAGHRGEGYWQQVDVKWFRVPCVDPIKIAQPGVWPRDYGFPMWTKHGVQLDTTLRVTNSGNCSLQFSITPQPSTWLDVTPPAGMVGPMQDVQITVHLNKDGYTNAPGTTVHHAGFLIISFNGIGCGPVSEVDSIPVDLWVTDTVIQPVWDTLATACTRLTIGNTGNFGHRGIGKVNMDYIALGGDCDTTSYYLYDGSPIVCYTVDGVVNCSYQFAQTGFADTNGLKPVGSYAPVTDSGDYYYFESGKIVTADSMIAIEKTWYAPKNNNDSCSFMIERVTMYLNTDRTPVGNPQNIRIGEIIDWDIPSDSGKKNIPWFDISLNLIFFQGVEGGGGCQSNANRWGGIAFLDGFKNSARLTLEPHGAYTALSSEDIYPWQTINEDTAFKYMANGGYKAESPAADQYMLMTFDTIPDLTPVDTYTFFVEIVSHRNGDMVAFERGIRRGLDWYIDHVAPLPFGCCLTRGNVDGVIGPAGPPDVSDLTYLIAYLFVNGPEPPCIEEGNVDAVLGVDGPIDVADLTYLVAWLFQGGTPPPPCFVPPE